jgi:hypothetical protein
MIFFRYRRYLESQVKELQSKITELEQKNWELVKVLMPHRDAQAPVKASEMVKSKTENHHITKGSNIASCTCDWHFTSNDPAALQDAIQQHHAATTINIRARRGWAGTRAKIEAHTAQIMSEEN